MRPRMLVPAVVVVAGVAVALALALTSSGTTPATRRDTARGFVGVMVDGPVLTGNVDLGRQLDSMVAGGVESLRVAVNWSLAQPYQTMAQVPAGQRSQFQLAGGVPTSFSALDRIVGLAAARGLSLLPVVQYAPAWDALKPGNPASAPRSTAPYAEFLIALVRRYGPHGTFWSTHRSLPVVPIRMWQIWNEPDFLRYWSQRPFAPSYVRLLRAAHAALQSADPGGKVVLGGLPDFSWQYLAQIYAVPGARRQFDVVAIHPYTAQPVNVIKILRLVRAVMDRSGDAGKPILATEISWPSSQGKVPDQFGIGTNERLQAERLNAEMPLLAANRAKLGLMGFYWYTWMGDESPPPNAYAFDYAGLLKYVGGNVSAKPALGVFTRGALAIEGCRRKGSVAGACS